MGKKKIEVNHDSADFMLGYIAGIDYSLRKISKLKFYSQYFVKDKLVDVEEHLQELLENLDGAAEKAKETTGDSGDKPDLRGGDGRDTSA